MVENAEDYLRSSTSPERARVCKACDTEDVDRRIHRNPTGSEQNKHAKRRVRAFVRRLGASPGFDASPCPQDALDTPNGAFVPSSTSPDVLKASPAAPRSPDRLKLPDHAQLRFRGPATARALSAHNDVSDQSDTSSGLLTAVHHLGASPQLRHRFMTRHRPRDASSRPHDASDMPNGVFVPSGTFLDASGTQRH